MIIKKTTSRKRLYSVQNTQTILLWNTVEEAVIVVGVREIEPNLFIIPSLQGTDKPVSQKAYPTWVDKTSP